MNSNSTIYNGATVYSSINSSGAAYCNSYINNWSYDNITFYYNSEPFTIGINEASKVIADHMDLMKLVNEYEAVKYYYDNLMTVVKLYKP